MTRKPETENKLTVENGLHIIVCAAILVVFALYALFPLYKKYEQLNASVFDMKCEQMEYAVLLPFYVELNSTVRSPQSDALKAIEVEHLQKEDFADIHVLMQGMSEECGLTLLKATPHVHSVSAEKRYICLNVSVKGEFSKMQSFIQAVVQMPSFFDLERLKIAKCGGEEQLELQIWLLVN